ncbi:ABC transporter permease [Pseudomonas typographi]|uniref:ABC transporter permease n=1 Tax=Pseudomonas typographi TaxID=2715964 RepID=A0ABR7YWU9_9PSED|nr:ABC transporter permease [Pseudomonas typographi]MBD1597677.1 ABC transporter permease [Pseudomonas typographi]
MATVFKRYCRQPAAVLGALFIAVLAALALAAPWLSASPWEMNAHPLLLPFTERAHWLGTDMLGRDLGAGLLYGARVSLGVGALASAASLLVGLLVGAAAGYFGGWVDAVLMRVAEFFLIMPSLVLAVLLVAVLEPSTTSVVMAIALVAWPGIARLVRSEFMTLRQREFVQAAQVLGLSPWAIITREILPNAMGPLLVTLTFVMASAILTEAALAFLGLGDPEAMSWGYMINASRNLLRDAWWMSLLPGLAIVLLVLAVNRVGEGLRSALQVPGRTEASA